MQTVLERIKKEAQKLTPTEQLRLVEDLAHQLRKALLPKETPLDLNGLYGLGKDLWKGEDAQEYVNQLREDRI